MNVLTFSQARAGLKQALDDVCRDHEPALITRQRGEPVVLLSLKDYNAMEETLYLLGSGENAKRLRQSIALHKAGKAFTKEISLNVPAEQEAEE
ncbi:MULTISPECIES: type II toxin-antitoxin system Phd/YefM family antitoxin [Pseudomonas]|uniref:type II toxin-antitoxin system Phd/YefM family antitoxin n=1 Tax=Pseudomonas TaxID=286 RepID=UPI0007619DE8|nr:MULTISPECIES: type II toxin-antitoxin system prevent-host-death family antitoxin [Pseudomonas]MDG9809424.1 type II toxin-antitoxin system prevent-host-death family antitoxin [Pseudomonas juntendi]MDG9815780.1 type II toxin-antitoxin system prevent-host-death family antitoxin [Pseudomonas putida]